MIKELKQLYELKRLGKKPGEIRLAADNWKNDFQRLVAILLSARTTDEITIKSCEKLFRRYPNAEKLYRANPKDIEHLIKSVNFYRNKTKSLLKLSKVLIEKYNGKVPKNFDLLIQLPGVGRKTANVFLASCGKDAIGVDTHLNYISRKLGWTKNTKPEKIEEDLKKIFPKKYWKMINPIAVRFGKTYTNKKIKDKLLEKIKKIK
ncbi:MAG: endonuclease III [Candidatus Pacearchaeota archaeon]|nr:MAG: endonuclease III [Candidatus Pacearchaeota archaeon]